ncbi:hypothetical protein HDG37_006577, partial [Paraburkholderia sp. MM5384-R2]|nr:hypothetical protein [Paraburkholderia sp. MM5384-R2]
MRKLKIPDLTFPSAIFTDRQIPWDLQYMLYPNAARLSPREFSRIDKRLLGPIIMERLPLVLKLKELLEEQLVVGTSQRTVQTYLYCLRYFYRWADDIGRSPTLASARVDFLDWTEYLLQQRATGVLGRTFYPYAANVGHVFELLLDTPVRLLRQSRIRRRDAVRTSSVLGRDADKQNISESFAFGHMLLDLSDALTVEAIEGTLPVRIPFRTGRLLEEWCGFVPLDSMRFLSAAPYLQRASLEKRKFNPDAPLLRTRRALANLRTEAELLIFIACTGMNLAQARALKAGRFAYASHHDGYQVRRIFKDRRKGEVEFDIYREYREHLDCYLVWRQKMFPGDDRLFPPGLPHEGPHESRLRAEKVVVNICWLRFTLDFC